MGNESNSKTKNHISQEKTGLPKSILTKIKSKYCLDYLFDYIKDDSFKYKLFVYSKFFQEKIDLNLEQYQAKFIERYKLNPKLFLSFRDYNSDISLGTNILKEGLSKYLSMNKIENKIFQIYLIKFFEIYFKENDENLYIDIFSPYSEQLYKSNEIFRNMFIILNIDEIKKYNLELKYNSFFKGLEGLKNNYYSLSIKFYWPEDLNYLSKLNIDFHNLKRLELNFGCDTNNTNPNSIQAILFSNKNLEYNLEYLHLICSGETIDYNIFKQINNFKSLKELNLERIKFDKIIELDLPNLIKLSFSFSNNIVLSEKTSLKIKKIFFYKFNLDSDNLKYKFPELEECRCDIQYLNKIDVISLKNLKKLILDCTNKSPVILSDLIEQIPNLLSLSINLDGKEEDCSKKSNEIEIFESPKVKIKDFSLKINNVFSKINLEICNFEYISTFKFNLSGIRKCYHFTIIPEIYFPIFEDVCDIKFNYLRIFDFSTYNNKYDYIVINNNVINNLYNNLEKLNNLKSFKFITASEFIEIDFYRNFIKKLLTLGIYEIEFDIKIVNLPQYIDIKDIAYTEKELKLLFPKIKFSKFKKLVIKKLKGKDEFVE